MTRKPGSSNDPRRRGNQAGNQSGRGNQNRDNFERDGGRGRGSQARRDDNRDNRGGNRRDDNRDNRGGNRRDDYRDNRRSDYRSSAPRPKRDEPRFEDEGPRGPQRGQVRRGNAARTPAQRKEQRAAEQQARRAPKGPKPFKDERFGQDLGPVPHHKRRRRGPSKPVTATPRVSNPDGERLQKVMAHAGVASRRECEEMIATGRVEVNGKVVRELGVRVKPDEDTVHVDGVRLQLNEDLVYFVFNKPAGVVSSMHDDEGRRDISDFLREGQSERLYHVGRLDYETEGLLLLTNDGELAHRLTHPSFEVPKTYLVQVRGPMPAGVGKQLRDGVQLEDGYSSVDSFRLVDSTPGKVLVEVVLHSGKNRIVRRMFDAVGFPVLRLVRMQIGPIRLGDQRQGSLRKLGRTEVGHLLAEVGL
ncbi:MAG: pseudouridine synthase [Galactobacter sp.]|uniref:pseudouridine synthase n=1 Tax=Galactobacter sp. TaxID=2676125 RepID=UPI0025BE1487|nr:pseudouridine synthase [Galactobacter sp.]